MPLAKWAFIGLVALPAAEIVVLLIVAALVGWLWAALLFIGSSALGILLLRRSGRRGLARLADGFAKDGWRGVVTDAHGLLPALGAFLLILPGFITDVVGAALLIPGVGTLVARGLTQITRKRRPRDGVIDLEPGEWRRITEKKGRRPRSRRKA